MLDDIDDLLNDRIDSPEITKDTGVEKKDKEMSGESDTDNVGGENDKDQTDNKEDNNNNMSGIDTQEDNKSKSEEKGEDDKVKEMPKIEDAGSGKFVQEAVEKQRESERQAFQKLINENAKLDHNLQKAEDNLRVTESERDVLKIQLQTELEKTEELNVQVKELEEELVLIRGRLIHKENTETNEENKESKDEEAVAEEEKNAEQKLRDLQLRIKRMAKDEEEKDRRIEHLERELEATEDVVNKLGKHVDESKFNEILAEKKKEQEEELQISTEEPRTNTVRGNEVAKSKVCIIM